MNNKSTPDLNTFLNEVSKISGKEYFRLGGMTFNNAPWLITMKKDRHYFPTTEIRKESAGWYKTVHEANQAGGRERLSFNCGA